MGLCKFSLKLLEKTDENGHFVKEWAQKHDDNHIFCNLCVKKINIGKGFVAIEQHAKGKGHKAKCSQMLAKSQLVLVSRRPSDFENVEAESVRPESNMVQLYSPRDKSTMAELQWVMKCVICNWSGKSCDGIRSLFCSMFGQDAVGDFSMSSTKFRYILTEALGPFFRDELLEDMVGAYYSLSFDETTNYTNAKELQIIVTYWSESVDLVVHHHLQSFFIGSATGEILCEKINEAIDNANLPRSKILMLGKNGPNVNKKVERLLNEEVVEIRGKPLINNGPCNVHVIHNSFETGVNLFGQDVSEIVIRLHNFFDDRPLRIEDFRCIQRELDLPEHNFVKHVSSRWLTLEDASKRLNEQWKVVLKYFLEFVSLQRNDTLKSKPFQDIVELLKIKHIKAQILFVFSSAKVFNRFTGTFQKSEPLIHILYDELKRLGKTLVGKVCKPSSIKKLGLTEKVLELQHRLLAKDLKLDDEVEIELSQLDETIQLDFRIRAQKHLVNACKYMLQKSAINSDFVRYCQCLQPKQRKSSSSIEKIVKLARVLLMNINTNLLRDEWRLLQDEKDKLADVRLDKYWSQFFQLKTPLGELKYPSVTRVVKAVLSLSHGNAEVERGFSYSAKYLTEDKGAMSERTLNAAMTVKSGLKKYSNKPELVSTSKKLLGLARNASTNYKRYLEEERKRKEEVIQKKKENAAKEAEKEEKMKRMTTEKDKITSHENKVKELKKNEDSKRKIENKLFEEASRKLKTAIERKNLVEVEVAKTLLDKVKQARKEADNQRKEADMVQKEISKKKNKLITEFFKK